MHLIDTHAHLMDEAFKEDFDAVWKRTFEEISALINIGCHYKEAKEAFELTKKHPNAFATVALHPIDAIDYNDKDWEALVLLAKEEKVCAIGETGLDYYWKKSSKEAQKELFIKHIELAKALNKPLVIHDRDAHRDTCDLLWANEAQKVGGVFHAYSGSVEMMEEVLANNFYISLGGVVTFKNAKTIKEVAKEVPLNRLLIETDCPYLTPTPFRGKRNEPSYVHYVAEEIALLKGINYEEVVSATWENALTLFKLNIKETNNEAL